MPLIDIEMFPMIGSHYTRKSSRRLYSDEKLSILKMYEQFVEHHSISKYPETIAPSFSVYGKIYFV